MSARKRALLLSIATVVYNLGEGAVAMIGNQLSGSQALFGFGLDSFVESLSGAVMIWRFWAFGMQEDDESFERIERRAATCVAYSLLALAAYVGVDATKSLIQGDSPEASWIAIALAITSIIVMPFLFLAKYRLGKSIDSPSLVADSKETLACLMLSVALLVGSGAFFLWRWWWLDSVTALVISLLIVREALETLKEAKED
ncbi:hypothetical protein FYK55_22820 [Roseiconus nitratireducens]|uniref:Cation efflux protein transmembrane domain-containing protein n=1 Tax=Roseiconus nitratireducens TaxID=2605748 RepID=A0A5M6D3X4_9BACT|nr:cation transporter [Roseiconus nitratireducens]KAA5539885.1 hypothetical protein FYK55_22820 [Roseiconus nitratireducens]